MHENTSKIQDNHFINETPFYTCNEISTYLGYSKQTKDPILLRKFKSVIPICKNLFTLEEINESSYFLKIQNISSQDGLRVVQKFEDFIPLGLFLEEKQTNLDFLYDILKNMVQMSKKSSLLNEISDFLDIDTIWINKEHNIKICWLTFIVKYQRYFDNTIHKLSLNTVSGVLSLFNLNKKRLMKRLSKNVNEIKKESRTSFYDIGENFFAYNSNIRVKHNLDITYTNIGHNMTEDDKESIRVCGTKKLCVANNKISDINKQTKCLINYSGVRLLLLKIFFTKENVDTRNIETYISLVKGILNDESLGSYHVTDKLTKALNFIISENNEPIEMENDQKENIDNERVHKLLSKIKQFVPGDLNINTKYNTKFETVHDIFVERGFNMADFDTRTYQKGRFYVCQAVPNSVKETKKDVDLNKIFQLIEIQNKQIEMIYQTLKEKNNIDKLIDDQLECLSLQANAMLTDLEKHDE
ncbi:hypothetical protein P3W45_000273 [Vairimorpha bombi]|jgi:hypothetical protein